MRAVSVHQPWAWAIFHAGKDVENRTWRTTHRGPLLIHASKTRQSYDRQDRGKWQHDYGVELPEWSSLPTQALIGLVDVIDCIRDSSSGWAQQGFWHWVLANPRPLPDPILFRGAQLLFPVPFEVRSLVG